MNRLIYLDVRPRDNNKRKTKEQTQVRDDYVAFASHKLNAYACKTYPNSIAATNIGTGVNTNVKQ